MKKNAPKKLTLSKETLRRLSPLSLTRAEGAGTGDVGQTDGPATEDRKGCVEYPNTATPSTPGFGYC